MEIAELHNSLTRTTDRKDYEELVHLFAKKLGWNPSYFINSIPEEKSNGFLAIEYGLVNSAIISFLNQRNDDLTYLEEENLVGISYNNLVNWHITIDERYVNYYYVLNSDIKKIGSKKIEVGNEYDALSIHTFNKIIEKKPNSNILALDDVLIQNISNWKRQISYELDNDIDLESLSMFFNLTIFYRSVEDNLIRRGKIKQESKLLVSELENNPKIKFSGLLKVIEERLNIKTPRFLYSQSKIDKFDKIDRRTLARYFRSFYENDHNRFKYDFSIITKQALSRIYQKYVNLLYIPDLNSQTQLFPSVPIEITNTEHASYYTPEYIARYFGKYILSKYNSSEFDKLKILEPSSGSGIFLRTLLEIEIENRISKNIKSNIDKLFKNITAIDIDPNACLATSLSLTLLYFTFKDSLIDLNVINGDSLTEMKKFIKEGQLSDVIVSNPPYINQNSLDPKIVQTYKDVLAEINNGKIDAYQAFLKLSVDNLKPNGFGMFVLPHNFLIGKSSFKLRNYILEHCTIEQLADLSAINVFEKVSTYTILLTLRKRPKPGFIKHNSWLMKCRANQGEALQNLLLENNIQEDTYQVYEAKNYFRLDKEWYILSAAEFDLLSKINNNIPLDTYLKVNQGVITGNDEVFIRDRKEVDKKELKFYKKYLPDKQIEKFQKYTTSDKLIFYPYRKDVLIEETILKSDYTKTYEYLKNKQKLISSRNVDVKSGKRKWWSLHRNRKIKLLESPKIIVPYLSISPKFAIDPKGEIITSHSPYLIAKDSDIDSELLYYFLGILNSIPCYWALSVQSQKQTNGYNIFHLKLLKRIPIPDPKLMNNTTKVSKMILLVKERINENNESKQLRLESKINNLAADLYGLDSDHRNILGIIE